MKRLAVILIIFLLSAPFAFGEKMYIRDISNITLRTGEGTDHKIIAMLKSGQLLEILEEGEKGWVKVLTSDRKEGWVLKSLLTSKEPSIVQCERLKKEYDDLISNADGPTKRIIELQEKNQKLAAELKKADKELKQLRNANKMLTKEIEEITGNSKDYLHLKTRFSSLQKESEKIKAHLKKLEDRQIFRWFLSGAGVLLAGMIVGYSLRKKRKRSSLL